MAGASMIRGMDLAGLMRMPFRAGTYAALAERGLLLGTDAPRRPPLFVLGLPRSGTTLVYQYIVHRLVVSYFTNGVGRFPQAPCLATGIQRMIHGDHASDFVSHYGKSTGPTAPREAGAFWGRFFDLENYAGPDHPSPSRTRLLRRTIARMERIFGGAPFVNKNVKHILRIGALRRVFPDCRFLVVERDRRDVALSLLRGRSEVFGDTGEWLSARPPDYEDLKALPAAEQIAGQLASLHDRMEEDLSELGGHNILRIEYGAFCREPEHLTEIIQGSMGPLGMRNTAASAFKHSRKPPRSEEERQLADLVMRTAG